MSKILFAFGVIISFIEFIYTQNANTSELRFIYNVLRHGARAPEHGVKNGIDMFGEVWAAPAELTEVGQRMHFLLGTRNRIKYGGFLSSTYDPTQIYARSSDYNRTNISGQSHVQGLFPIGTGPTLTASQKAIAFPSVYHNWNAAINTQVDGAIPQKINVLPIHIYPRDDRRYFFYYGFSTCTPLMTEFENNIKDPKIQDFMNKFRNQYGNAIVNALKLPTDYFNSFMNMHLFFDAFIAGYTQGKKLAILTDAGIDLKTMNVTAYDFEKMFIYDYYNGGQNMLAKITFSGMADELLTWVKTRVDLDISGKEEYITYQAPKSVFLFLHDVTLASFMTHLKNIFPEFNQLYYTPFASQLTIELHRTAGLAAGNYTAADYSITFNFNDNIFGPIKYTVFDQIIRDNHMTQDDIDDYCDGYFSFISFAFKHATIALGVLAGFFFILFIVVLICCKKCYRRKGSA